MSRGEGAEEDGDSVLFRLRIMMRRHMTRKRKNVLKPKRRERERESACFCICINLNNIFEILQMVGVYIIRFYFINSKAAAGGPHLLLLLLLDLSSQW